MEGYLVYSSFKELKGNTLKKGDHFSVSRFEFVTEELSFARKDLKDSNKIFEFLFIDKRKFFKKHFGYEPVIVHGFSHCKLKDNYQTLTAIALDLMERYEKNAWFFDIIEKVRKFSKKK